MARTRSRDVRCSFCGRTRDEVSRLVAGPGVYICDRCIALCNEVLAGAGPPSPPPPTAPHRPRRTAPALALRSWLRNLFRSTG